jgi:hypothetical protein
MHIKRLSEDGMLLFRRSDRGYEFKIFGYEEHQNSIPKKSTEPYSTDHGEAANANDIRKSDNGVANKVRRSAHGAANDVRTNSVVSEDNIYIYNNPPIVPPSEDWQQPPKRVSNENQTSGGASSARDVARRVAAKADAEKISVNGWPWLRRDENPKEFAAWIEWFGANNCGAQATIALGKGFMRVPAILVRDGEDIFRRKFLIANPSQPCNDPLSAKEV